MPTAQQPLASVLDVRVTSGRKLLAAWMISSITHSNFCAEILSSWQEDFWNTTARYRSCHKAWKCLLINKNSNNNKNCNAVLMLFMAWSYRTHSLLCFQPFQALVRKEASHTRAMRTLCSPNSLTWSMHQMTHTIIYPPPKKKKKERKKNRLQKEQWRC